MDICSFEGSMLCTHLILSVKFLDPIRGQVYRFNSSRSIILARSHFFRAAATVLQESHLFVRHMMVTDCSRGVTPSVFLCISLRLTFKVWLFVYER